MNRSRQLRSVGTAIREGREPMRPGERCYRYRAWLVLPPLLVALGLRRFEAPAGVCWPAGLLLFSAGVGLRVWAQEHIHYRLRVESRLTRTGPYARCRNPIYVANTLVCGGLTVLSGEVYLVVLTVLWCAALYHRVVRFEEAVLLERYGDAYRAYVARVPRWWPRRSGKPLALVNRHLPAAVPAEAHNLLFVVPFLVKELVT